MAICGVPASLEGRAVTRAQPYTLVVRVYDNFGVAAGELKSAETTADGVLKEAGIPVVWRECPPSPSPAVQPADHRSSACDEPLGSTEVILRIVRSSPQDRSRSLGNSLVDSSRRRGWLATIFADRIGDLASAANVSGGTIFGRAIAHEVGHLLLGTPEHSDQGLMRDRWTAGQFQQEKRWDWILSKDQATAMRRSLADRAREATPAAVTAAIGQP